MRAQQSPPLRLPPLLLALLAFSSPGIAQGLSPGPLSSDHAFLDNPGACRECHEKGRKLDESRCLACHERVARGLSAGQGFHAKLAKGKACASCHAEHHGRSWRLVRFESQVQDFDHADTGFALAGKHARLACARCHRGEGRYQGASPRCAGCHPGPHGGQLGDACDRCHDDAGFAGARRFDHARAAWPLEGRHAAVACDQCHPLREGRDRTYKPRTHAACSDCHADPHAAKMKGACAACHRVQGWKEVAKPAAEQHAPGRFPLKGRHRDVPCASCHGPRLDKALEVACATCHKDAHRGSLGGECGRCHDADAWANARARFDHDRSRFPLRGRHQDVSCRRCHVDPSSERRGALRFERCADCHADPHGPTAGGSNDRECERCHAVEGFVPARFGVDDHAKAAFGLTGAHRAVRCDACHRVESGPFRFATGRRACRDCHRDVHAGAFDARMGERGCATCHGTGGWRVSDFDHATTRFPLEGSHGRAACAACHGAPTGGASARFAGLDQRCGACHADPHRGQFRASEPARECDACHDTERFRGAPFEHARVTRFATEGPHAAPCERCHPIVEAETSLRLYRPTSAACAACHADPHAGRAGSACEACHAPTRWTALSVATPGTFDHDRTGFALRQRHAAQSCTTCHPGAPRGRGGDVACHECHEDRHHRGAEGDDCARCHSPRGWTVPAAIRSHDATRFPLVGAHRAADCQECHGVAEPPVYAGTPTECLACHAADVRAAGNHPDHVAAGFPDDCAECHGQFSWSPARIRHARFWPLRGAHAAADCSGCHAGGQYGGTPTTCSACHAGQAAAVTEPDHRDLGTEPCDTCHGESGWAPARAGWHEAFFPIQSGDHRGFACADCHAGGSMASATCTACHAHTRTRMDQEHDHRTGYQYDDAACLGCHPRGDD